MQLSKIKIAGFKSFVDPTTIAMDSRLVAVVGPNGCGKSNIIDAVTWVMGESSPKYLRGEALTDVIFNGSNARKPIGQASVELIFDNQDGKIGGEYAQFNEISVKRMINRESDSTYYLNGVRCRKRDVVDIFLGTGLGPRSYSIIGQNMISRIIEAKPDDLRSYLEEAAGISKYKERRHETELRIRHTQENLDRVQDVHVELEKQLAHLKNQANTAEKYKSLKQDERLLKAEYIAIQRRTLDEQINAHQLKAQQCETEIEEYQSKRTALENQMNVARLEQKETQESYEAVQAQFYEVGNQITKLEQHIEHQKEKHQRLVSEYEKSKHDHSVLDQEIITLRDEIEEREQEIETLQPSLDEAKKAYQTHQSALQSIEANVKAAEQEWETFSQKVAALNQTLQVEQNNMTHYERHQSSLTARITELEKARDEIDLSELQTNAETLAQDIQKTQKHLDEKRTSIETARADIQKLKTKDRELISQLDLLKNDGQRLRGKQASLEALQETALGRHDQAMTPWLKKHNIDELPRLGQVIDVEKGWENIVESVLDHALQAICVENFENYLNDIKNVPKGNLSLIALERSSISNASEGPLLINKVNTQWPIDGLLHGVYCCENIDEAFKITKTLQRHESVVSKDGFWLGVDYIKVLQEDNPSAGIFQREEALKKIAAELSVLEKNQHAIELELKSIRAEIEALEKKHDVLLQEIQEQQKKIATLQAQHDMHAQKMHDKQAELERCQKAHQQAEIELENNQAAHVKARSSYQAAEAALKSFAEQKQSLLDKRDQSRNDLHIGREKLSQHRENVHEIEMRLQTIRSQKTSFEQHLQRLEDQLENLKDKLSEAATEIEQLQSLTALDTELHQLLDYHNEIKDKLQIAREILEKTNESLQQLSDEKHHLEKKVNELRQQLEGFRLSLEGWRVKSEGLVEQFAETSCDFNVICSDLPEDADADAWKKKLDQITNRIQRLGPINLVAIEEYASALERKEYLDRQLEDLQNGMQTLRDAIDKIDQETKNRFKDTFDEVNQHFQRLFPTVFGGGKAYLELNSNDLLTAGVTMMACPPGKRNSSIYLLSGGEKSLTAIALIFSIFQLNPAPFCLLDEVDAALDDANVLRFTKLVKAMTSNTQFVFISHNKITIEMGDHLIGVTMNEPGVSRLVSVNLAQAVDMVGT